METIFYVLVGLLTALDSCVSHPSSAKCASGFYPEGVRPEGDTRCLQEIPEHGPIPEVRLSYPIRIYCPVEHRAIVVGERGVACSS